MKRGGVVLFIALAALCQTAVAEQNLGKIEGIVRDSSGAVVPSVPLVARNVATGVEQSTTTDTAGAYSFPAMVIGEYTITTKVSGFQTSVRSGVRVISGMAQTVDFDLVVGATNQTITVTAKSAIEDTASSSLGTTLVTEEVTELPVAMTGGLGGARGAQAYITLLPGVVSSPQATGFSLAAGANVDGAIGNEGGGFAYKIDGAEAGYYGTVTDYMAGPLPEAVSEFRVSVSPNAEEGWFSGVGMSLVMKSGTNQLHGSLYEYVRNNWFDARNFFAKTPSVNKQNEFGGAVGGPIVIPKVYNGKDRTFFFVTYDTYRYRMLSTSQSATVPTAQMRQGDFSQWLGPQTGTDSLGRPIYKYEIYDPATTRPDPSGAVLRDPFMYGSALNVIAPNQLSKVSQAFEKYYNTPTVSGITAPNPNWYGSQTPFPTNQERLSIKIDHALSSTQRISGGYDDGWVYNLGGTGVFPPQIDFQYINGVHQPRIRLSYTWNIQPNLLLGVNASYLRWQQIISNPNANQFGVQSGFKGPFTGGTPRVTMSDNSASAFGQVFSNLNAYFGNWPESVYLAWTKGRHNFKVGAEYLLVGDTQLTEIYSDGNVTFSPLETALPAQVTTGIGYASYLLGQADNSSLPSVAAFKQVTQSWGLYGQDQWRITNKLTLNYGLRYDLFVPQHETYNRVGSFDPTIPNPVAGGIPGAITFWGNGPGRNGRIGEWNLYTKGFGPRIGLAYAWNPKTVIRASYGVNYIPYFTTIPFGTSLPGYGWQYSLSLASTDSGVTPAFQWDNPVPFVVPTLPNTNPSIQNGTSVTWLDVTDNKPGMAQNFTLGVTRELPGAITATAQYVGTMTHNNTVSLPKDVLPLNDYLTLKTLLLANVTSTQAQQAGIKVPYAGFKGSVQQALLPYPQYTGVSETFAPAGYSEYNSGQLTVQKRVGGGLNFLAGYTFERTLGLIAGPYTGTYEKGGGIGISVLTFSYTYRLPFGPGRRFANSNNPVLKQAIGGWEFTGIHNYQTGGSVNLGRVIPVPGAPVRTGVTCSNYVAGTSRYLAAGAFTPTPTYTLSPFNGYTNVPNCAYLNENLSLAKSFFVKETIRPRFGVDLYNAFNRHEWLGLNGSVTSPSYGAFSSASAPRTIQVWGRLEF